MAKSIIIEAPKGITAEQFAILDKCAKDPFYFSKFINVIHPVKGKVPFILYHYQVRTLWEFLTNRFNIVLKFRQAGLTELISMYCLWLAIFHPNKNIQIISIKDRVAKKVLRRIRYMYRNLPWYLQIKVVNGRPGEFGTATEVEFSNGSLITSIPTTEDAGRSEAVSLLVIDEAAIVRWATQIWAAAFPTLSTGGSAILNSTPYGVGNFFHKTWVDATAGGNEFTPIRLHWRMHPERDEEWYRVMASSLGPRRTAQEIDGDFLTSGNSVFDLLDIKAIEDMLSEIDIYEQRENGSLVIIKPPKPNTRMYIGADIASGRSRDYSAFSVMDRDGEEYAYYKGKIPVSNFADLLMKTGKEYNRAILAPESNDIGLAVTTKIQDSGYPNLFYTTRFLKEKGENKPKVEKVPGWYTTTKTRPIMIDELEDDIRNERITTYDRFFVAEAYTFIYDERNRPVAMGKNNRATEEDDILDDENTYTDDSIMAKSITNYVRKGKITTTVVAPV
jgi:hypothetical protein